MCGRVDVYLLSFAHLKTPSDKNAWPTQSHYRSPQMPLLILTIIDSIHNGSILRNFIQPDNDLQSTYRQYMHVINAADSQTDIAIPFFALAATTFWHLIAKPDAKPPQKTKNLHITKELFRQYYHGARFSEDLFTLLQMQHLRKKLRGALVEAHFGEEWGGKILRHSNARWSAAGSQGIATSD